MGINTSVYDSDIRPILRSRIWSNHNTDSDSVLVEELGICQGEARIDLAMVNGAINGYEIKSDRDSLRRLPKQIELYGKVLDRITLVVGDIHLSSALKIVPDWWGVIRFSSGKMSLSLETIRRAKKNKKRDPRVLVELIWRNEALALLEKRGLDIGVRTKPRADVWDKVCEYFTVDEIAEFARCRLKARKALQSRLT